MTPTQRLIQDLATAHGVDCETIVRAAVVDFALGRSERQRSEAICVVACRNAPHGDEKRHSTPNEMTKIVTGQNQ
jgi:hypothetical protein